MGNFFVYTRIEMTGDFIEKKAFEILADTLSNFVFLVHFNIVAFIIMILNYNS